jgi:hypothetical protein
MASNRLFLQFFWRHRVMPRKKRKFARGRLPSGCLGINHHVIGTGVIREITLVHPEE